MWFRLTPLTMLFYVVLSAIVGLLGRKLRGGFSAFFILSLIFTPALIVVLMALCRPATKPVRRGRRPVEPIPPRMPRGRTTKPHYGGVMMAPNLFPPETHSEARRIVDKYSFWSAAAGLFPLPGVDILLVSGTNLTMVRDLAAVYGVPFHAGRAKTVIASVIAGALPVALAGGLGLSRYLRAVPLIGQTIVPFGTSIFAGATTYALGGTFLRHFARGGTLLDMRADDVRDYFHHEYEKAKDVIDDEPRPATA